MKEILLLTEIGSLIDKYEKENDNCIIGCILSFDSDKSYQWNGERFTIYKIKIKED